MEEEGGRPEKGAIIPSGFSSQEGTIYTRASSSEVKIRR